MHELLSKLNVDIRSTVFFEIAKLYKKKSQPYSIKIFGKLFKNESMCNENHQVAYKYHQLKSAR